MHGNRLSNFYVGVMYLQNVGKTKFKKLNKVALILSFSYFYNLWYTIAIET